MEGVADIGDIIAQRDDGYKLRRARSGRCSPLPPRSTQRLGRRSHLRWQRHGPLPPSPPPPPLLVPARRASVARSEDTDIGPPGAGRCGRTAPGGLQGVLDDYAAVARRSRTPETKLSLRAAFTASDEPPSKVTRGVEGRCAERDDCLPRRSTGRAPHPSSVA